MFFILPEIVLIPLPGTYRPGRDRSDARRPAGGGIPGAGINPQVGRNTNGLLATANSIAKVDQKKFQGGTMQVELQPKFFDGKEEIWKYVRDFSWMFFSKGSIQINLNILDLKKLRDAMDHPESPEYQNIIVRLTG